LILGLNLGLSNSHLEEVIIVFSDLSNEIEVKLVGVFPEFEVLLPRINPSEREWNELSNGHTHLFMLCK